MMCKISKKIWKNIKVICNKQLNWSKKPNSDFQLLWTKSRRRKLLQNFKMPGTLNIDRKVIWLRLKGKSMKAHLKNCKQWLKLQLSHRQKMKLIVKKKIHSKKKPLLKDKCWVLRRNWKWRLQAHKKRSSIKSTKMPKSRNKLLSSKERELMLKKKKLTQPLLFLKIWMLTRKIIMEMIQMLIIKQSQKMLFKI